MKLLSVDDIVKAFGDELPAAVTGALHGHAYRTGFGLTGNKGVYMYVVPLRFFAKIEALLSEPPHDSREITQDL